MTHTELLTHLRAATGPDRELDMAPAENTVDTRIKSDSEGKTKLCWKCGGKGYLDVPTEQSGLTDNECLNCHGTGRAAEAPITPPNPPHWAEQQRLDAAAREWLTSLLGYRTTDDGRTWAQETRQLIDHLLSKLGEVQ